MILAGWVESRVSGLGLGARGVSDRQMVSIMVLGSLNGGNMQVHDGLPELVPPNAL
jgi:hypothetical protein